MNHTEFAVTRYQNRNGAISWRVTGWLHSIRIRRNFKTREEAAAERATLEIKALQAASGLHAVATVLTEDQIRDAEAVFRRLSGKPHSLSFYVDFAVSNYREPEQQKPLSAAISDYVSTKTHEFEQKHISLPQMARIRWDLKRLHSHFRGKSVADLTVASLVTFLELGRPALKTYNNRRGIISTFLKFCYLHGWIAENPVQRIPQHRIRQHRGLAHTFTAGQAREFMEFIEGLEDGRFVPYYALCLFAGIRPGVPGGEITKLRPEAVDLDAGVINVSAEASKVREPRKVAVQSNLAAWLRAYPLKKFPIVVGNFQKRRAKFAKRFNLTHDVLRHTFISMFVAKFRSIGEAALQAGNSESIIRKHYLDLKSKEEAGEFFGILPQRVVPAGVVTPFAPGADVGPTPAEPAA
jgi:site-specific recombinase XerD